MIPLILMGIGMATQMAGQYEANKNQARAELKNAKWLQEQADFAQVSEMRAQDLAGFDYSQKIGSQISSYAGSGVDISGSAALTVGGTVGNYINEAFAIKRKGDMDYKLASQRGQLATDTASTLTSGSYNGMQAAGTLISTYNSTGGFGTLKK